MSEELKPCPFCGGEAEYSKIDTSKTVPFGTMQHFVTCKKNCFEGLYARGNTKEEAIKAWNTRPNPWHTGTPTEKGTYLVNDGLNDYGISYFDGEKFSYVYFPNKGVIRLWQRIEPYKEKKDDCNKKIESTI